MNTPSTGGPAPWKSECCVMKIAGGKVTEWREYFDHGMWARLWTLNQTHPTASCRPSSSTGLANIVKKEENIMADLTGNMVCHSYPAPRAIEDSDVQWPCDLQKMAQTFVVTGRAKNPDKLPQNEKDIGWTGVASLAEEIEAMGRKAIGVEGDVTNKADIESIVSAAKEKFGRIHILINNAAVPSGAGEATILDMEDELWYDTVDVNLNGIYLMSKGRRAFDARCR